MITCPYRCNGDHTITSGTGDITWFPGSMSRPGVFQVGSDSSPMSERPCTAVPVGLLRPGRRCRHSAASAFHQPSTTCNTSLPAQHLWLSGLLSCRPHSLELSPGFYPGPHHQCKLFQTFAKNVFVRSILVHSARLRFLTITALYKSTYLLAL